MDTVEAALYVKLAYQSKIQLSNKYESEDNNFVTIIVFQRLISEINSIFLYAYNSNSSTLIKQQQFDVDQLKSKENGYYDAIKLFLLEILVNRIFVCLHFKNYGPDFLGEQKETIQHALRLLELPHPSCKAFIWIKNTDQANSSNGYLTIKHSNQHVILKYQQDNEKLEDYEKFTLNQLKKVDEIHEKFAKQLDQNEQYVKMYNIYSLIKDVTLIHDIPNSIYYLARLLVNLPKFTYQETDTMIFNLQLIQQNQYPKKYTKKIKATKLIKQVISTHLAPFKDEKNLHFPMRGLHSQKCKVCQKQNNQKVHKSSFICESCHKYYKINVTLCTIKCFKQFHLNPVYYLERSKLKQKVKIEE
ncbi:unnamed protein product (macronuclear) [Paramecium tetraurelia]|uniref:PiggyBac transposable element-derived protein domain-containing protein n=1 Tax=Paramecium tetraurelia TaxID=5888 RepID=A0C7G6_PARTE|nr:uncharacterized protein GSPATT00035863001 [Paramecium tetraurelia]CAK66733.1 unnamed protein product [Paramecium tetraurelia]|eukprot:XP_001434130.1 hypothetical protein (macronuclear) [Paramecium tetraurelia strain d4-2]